MVAAWIRAKGRKLLLPRRYSAQRMPYRPQPKMVAKANRAMDRGQENRHPTAVYADKGRNCQLSSSVGSVGDGDAGGRMTRAVMVQMTSVSANTSKMP